MASRGYKNNNPGNIVKTNYFFLGEKKNSTDDKFRQFTSMEYGYRAMFIMLTQWINNGTDTLSEIINKYAPASENNTNVYIKNLSNYTGISSTKKIKSTDKSTLTKLVAGISKIENGIEPNIQLIKRGYNLTNTKTMIQEASFGLPIIILLGLGLTLIKTN